MHTLLNLSGSNRWFQAHGHIQRAIFNLSGEQNKINRYEHERFVRSGDHKGGREVGVKVISMYCLYVHNIKKLIN